MPPVSPIAVLNPLPVRGAMADAIGEMREQTEAALLDSARQLLSFYPVADYLAAWDAAPPLAPYHHVPASAQTTCARIAAQHGEAALEAYQRLAMLAAMAQPADRGGLTITAEIEALRARTFSRIVSDMRAPRRRFYRHGNDLFAKDFALCRGKLLPGGVELIDRSAGIGRRVLIEGGVAGLPGRARFFLGELGGFKPVFETHFDRRLIGEFHAEGYAAFYARLADLLALNPQIRGAASGSWWHDPHLTAISPELGFINAIPESAGARLFPGAESADAVASAIRFAPQRAALHKQGLYRPRNYLLAWPRRDAIAWGERRRAG